MNRGPAEAAMRAALDIEVAATLESIQTAVRGFATQYGYDRFVLFSASAAIEEVVEQIYWVEGDWFDNGKEVDAQTYVRRCPVTLHLLNARQPFFWRKEQVKGEERYQVIRAPGGPGIQGLQVPIFGPQGLEGAMSLGGVAVDGSARVRLGLSIVTTAAFFAPGGYSRPPWMKRSKAFHIASARHSHGLLQGGGTPILRRRWAYRNALERITCAPLAVDWVWPRQHKQSAWPSAMVKSTVKASESSKP